MHAVGNMCIHVKSCSSPQYICLHTCTLSYASHTKPIRERLCTRGGRVQEVHQSGLAHNPHFTANWKNVTEVTVELVQHSDGNTEN